MVSFIRVHTAHTHNDIPNDGMPTNKRTNSNINPRTYSPQSSWGVCYNSKSEAKINSSSCEAYIIEEHNINNRNIQSHRKMCESNKRNRNKQTCKLR